MPTEKAKEKERKEREKEKVKVKMAKRAKAREKAKSKKVELIKDLGLQPGGRLPLVQRRMALQISHLANFI